MSTTRPLPRPSQVTLFAWMIMGGSLYLVGSGLQRLSNLRSLDTRESVEKFLAEPAMKGSGLTVEGALQVLHVVSLVMAGAAAAALILGLHVLRRNRSARIGLTILAVPIFVSGLLVGGFMSSLVAVAALMLWLQPSRDWFNGIVTVRTAPLAPPAPETPATPDTTPHPAAPTHDVTASPLPPAYQPWPPAPAASGPLMTQRPRSLEMACFVTWIANGIAAIMMIVGAVTVALAPDTVLDQLREDAQVRDAGWSDSVLLGIVFGTAAFTVLVFVSVMVLAFVVWRGHDWARIMLLVVASLSMALALAGIVAAGPLLAVFAAAAGWAVVLLTRSESVTWCAQRARRLGR